MSSAAEPCSVVIVLRSRMAEAVRLLAYFVEYRTRKSGDRNHALRVAPACCSTLATLRRWTVSHPLDAGVKCAWEWQMCLTCETPLVHTQPPEGPGHGCP